MQSNFNIQSKTNHIYESEFQSMQVVKPGSTLFCNSGILWITQTGDRQDYVLMPGQKMTVSKRGKVVVEAVGDADFHLA